MSALITVRRADTDAALAANAVLGNNATHIGSLAMVADDGTGAVGLRKWNGTSWAAALLGTASIGALVGDVIDPPGANHVVGMTGTLGVVAMHGTEIRSDTVLTIQPTQVVGAGAGHALAFNGGGSTGGVGGMVKIYGGTGVTSGNVDIRPMSSVGGLFLSSTKTTSFLASFEFDNTVSAASIAFESKSGVGNVLAVTGQTSTDNVGGGVQIASGSGGGGNLPGDVLFVTGVTSVMRMQASSPSPIVHVYASSVRWDEAATTPALFQAQRTTDATCHNLLIKSQAPFADAVDFKLPGNIIYEVPAPAAGGDPPGYHSFVVSGVEYVNITTTHVTLRASIFFANAFLVGATPTIYCEQAADTFNGQNISIEGQGGGAGNTHGGSVYVTAGARQGTGINGAVVLAVADFATSVQVVAVDNARSVVALCADAAFVLSDVPSTGSNYIYIGDMTSFPTTNPTGGCVIGSLAGRFAWGNADGKNFEYDGTISTTTGGATGEYVTMYFNNIPRKVQLFFT